MKADETHFFSTLVPAILCMILSCSKFATGLQQQKQIAKSLDVRLEDYRDESNIPKSRKKRERSVVFPLDSTLKMKMTMNMPIAESTPDDPQPTCNAQWSTLVLGLPLQLLYFLI